MSGRRASSMSFGPVGDCASRTSRGPCGPIGWRPMARRPVAKTADPEFHGNATLRTVSGGMFRLHVTWELYMQFCYIKAFVQIMRRAGDRISGQE